MASENESETEQATEADQGELQPALAMVSAETDIPLFAQEYPDDAELKRLLDAFQAGNYALVRVEAPKLAERSEDAAVKAAARDLARRIEPAPLVMALLGLAAVLLAYLVYFYFTHQHEAQG